MAAPKDFTVLDALLTKAMAHQTPKKERRRPDAFISPEELAAAEKKVLARWRAPENWERNRSVVLIHQDPNTAQETLLGNFVEYKHKHSKGVCRKLVRDNTPAVVGEIEYVTGDNWLAKRVDLESLNKNPLAPAEETREAIVDLHLPELDHVFAPAVMVTVNLLWGGINRVELFEETRFFSKDRKVQLILPEGLDVLEAMSLDCKLELRKFLAL
jgi:hypothetical protein